MKLKSKTFSYAKLTSKHRSTNLHKTSLILSVNIIFSNKYA